MGSRQSAKLMEGTWVGLLMGEKGRMWTTEVQRVKVELKTVKKKKNSKPVNCLSYQFDDLQTYFYYLLTENSQNIMRV